MKVQFSVKSLMAFSCCVALIMAVFGKGLRDASHDRKVSKQLVSHGATVELSVSQDSRSGSSFERAVHAVRLPLARVKAVKLHSVRAEDIPARFWDSCAQLSHIAELHLPATVVEDPRLVGQMRRCRGLRVLHINRVIVTDQILAELKGLPDLEAIHFGPNKGPSGDEFLKMREALPAISLNSYSFTH